MDMKNFIGGPLRADTKKDFRLKELIMMGRIAPKIANGQTGKNKETTGERAIT